MPFLLFLIFLLHIAFIFFLNTLCKVKVILFKYFENKLNTLTMKKYSIKSILCNINLRIIVRSNESIKFPI